MELTDARQKMEGAFGLLRQDLNSLKAGRATPLLVERIMIEAYGTKMALMELATISVAGPNQLIVTPFDQMITKDVVRSLAMDRGLGISPIQDGNIIRLNIPPLTEERRKELVKVLGQKLETTRIMIRQIRGDKMREIREAGAAKLINEDEKFRLESELQKITDEFNEKIEQVGSQKEEELLSV